ncbi:SDR family oxidoreductase [Roseicitreum antarcticum]|uniref:NAD(P)-dependent dehydrogenase, short-chain alcohol dehydrogenase family n=1 Tax=Roseicitreum antarcticum TaxID=564137 RepID=A0A1H2UGM5_9RHOB|nr:SDR family oxidoreductase [Roseicitreum antarcticum]SDW55245.1 NAD(P)-dependent dehydrogenase, short-chain alcohol dehydrogenase family [Roseicitreum antarcticum]
MSKTPGTKTLLISGGSRGIGRETALRAAERGWSVAITYRTDSVMAARTVQEIEDLGARGMMVQGNVCTEADVTHNFRQVADHFGRIDAVVVNAGIVGPSMPLAQMSADRIRNMVEVNLLGALLFAREAARYLPRDADEPSGALVFVSSVAARLGAPFEYVDYAAAKGAIDTLTLGLSKELAAQNIRVNAVRPGLIETEIHASGGQPDRAQRLGKLVPMARAGRAREVANAIIWLCSDEASYTTGAVLDVTGGR